MSKSLTTNSLPPRPDPTPMKPEPALTTNKTQPVWPVLLGAARERFTGKDMLTTGGLGQAQEEAAKKGGKKA